MCKTRVPLMLNSWLYKICWLTFVRNVHVLNLHKLTSGTIYSIFHTGQVVAMLLLVLVTWPEKKNNFLQKKDKNRRKELNLENFYTIEQERGAEVDGFGWNPLNVTVKNSLGELTFSQRKSVTTNTIHVLSYNTTFHQIDQPLIRWTLSRRKTM